MKPLRDSLGSSNEVSEEERERRESKMSPSPRVDNDELRLRNGGRESLKSESRASTNEVRSAETESKLSEDDHREKNNNDENASNDEDDITEGNETIDEKRDSMKRFVADLRSQTNIEEENESDGLKMFKDQIIDIKKPKQKKQQQEFGVKFCLSFILCNLRDGNVLDEKKSVKDDKDENDETFLTAVQTNDSGDVIVTRLKKSEVEENTLILNPRNSLDPESSLKRDIDEYVRVMERQEQMLIDNSRRNSIEVEGSKTENNKIEKKSSKIFEEDEEENNELVIFNHFIILKFNYFLLFYNIIIVATQITNILWLESQFIQRNYFYKNLIFNSINFYLFKFNFLLKF